MERGEKMEENNNYYYQASPPPPQNETDGYDWKIEYCALHRALDRYVRHLYVVLAL